jgi:hypothetical protein
MSETNALMGLKNAWQGAADASSRVGELTPQLDAADALTSLDLDALHARVLAQAIAVQALRGVIEQLRGEPAA